MDAMEKTLILGTTKGLLMFTAGKHGWQVHRETHPGISVSAAAWDPRTGILWAGLETDHWGPKLQRSHDVGMTWEDVETPQYPAGSVMGEGVPAKLRYIWVLAPGGQDEPDRFYVGTEPGGLFVSDDGGSTFSIMEGLWNHPSRLGSWFGAGRDYPGVHSVLVDPRDSRHLWAGVSVAGAFESWDAGLTWTPRNRGLEAPYLPDPNAEVGHDPHLLVMCPAAPDMLWQQNHVGIFRSIDGGANWQDVSQPSGPAYFGFPIAVHATNPEVAWVVPAQSDEVRVAFNHALCVCRTEDGGKTWTTFRTGLPQRNCYDLVYRHGLALSGDTLAIGTTTGNLFVSQDAGESWECLGQNFPPIVSVRFGV